MAIHDLISFLVVDDKASVCQSVVGILNGMEFQLVDTSLNGRDALNKLHKGRINFVLADLEMPGMSGLELCKAIKEDENLSRIPVLIMATDPSREEISAAAAAGAAGVVIKPFTGVNLGNQILKVIQRSKIPVLKGKPK